METKPLLIVQSSKRISAEKAYKSIAKFAQSESTGASTLPDDVTCKLTTLEQELHTLLDANALSGNATVDGSGKKKRKTESEADGIVEKKAKKEKKDKKDKKEKKDKSRSDIEPIDIHEVVKTSKSLSTDNSLANMKKAVSKMK